jgi:hypothetical protein
MRKIHQSFIATLEQFEQANPDNRLAVTTESIAFQTNDTFGPRLEEVVGKFKALVDSGVKKRVVDDAKELREELSAVINSRLNIKVEIITNQYLAATIPNVYVPHNPVIRDDIRFIYETWTEIGGQELITKLKNKTVVGSVDTKNARVSGWFSQQECPVFIDFYTLFSRHKQTVPEVTAIILHELGHVMKGIIFCANINSTNQVLGDIARNISGSGHGDVKYVYSKIKSIYPEATMEIAEGLCSGNRVVMNVSAYRTFVGATKTLMNNSTYDRTTYEAMSDQFATRFGYGLSLITALEKFEGRYSEYEASVDMYESVKSALLFTCFTSLACFALVMVPAPAARIFGLLIGTMFSFLTKILIDTQRPSTKDMTYDNIRDRYMRIRNQIVELIKDPELSTDVKSSLLNEISAIDIIIEDKKVFRSSLERLAAAVIPSDRKAVVSIQQQREIEDMIANDIFVSAQRLSLRS